MLMVLLLRRQGNNGNTAGGRGTLAAVRQLVRVPAADPVLNFDLDIMHSCSPREQRNVICPKYTH